MTRPTPVAKGDDLPPVSVVFDLIAQLAIKDGAAPMTRWPEGWKRVIDEHWTIWVNGGPDEIKVQGVAVPRFTAYVEFNGWPAGMVNPFEGWIAAGEVANEGALIKALKAALA